MGFLLLYLLTILPAHSLAESIAPDKNLNDHTTSSIQPDNTSETSDDIEVENPIDPSCEVIESDRHLYAANLTSDDRINTLLAIEGKTIRNVDILSLDVFDTELEKEDKGLYRFLNRIHARTRSGVISSQLLFKVGEPFITSKITESERILRSRAYLINAFVMPVVICDETVDLVVVTRDAWTTEPKTTLSHSGGETNTGFGLSEGNVAGSGNSFTFGYENTQNRERVFYNFYNPHFLEKPIDFAVGYAETTDGEDTLLKLSQPFYSLDTPKSIGIISETINIEEKIRQGEVLINDYRHKSLNLELFYGRAIDINRDSSSRVFVGIKQETDLYRTLESSSEPAPISQEIYYPWVGYEYVENKFRVYRNINQIQRAEDIPVGLNLKVKLGYGKSDRSIDGDVIRYNLSLTDAIGLGKDHLMTYSVSLDGREYNNRTDIDTSVLNTSIAYNAFIDHKNRWFAGFKYSWGDDLAPHQKIVAGGDGSLRGYPLDYLRGNEMTLLTLERRYFTDIHVFNLLRVGYVAFYDFGKMWGGTNRWSLNSQPTPGEEYTISSGSRALSNVGFGLRLTSSKTHIGNIIHLDVAFPLADRDIVSTYQISVQAQQTF